MRAGAALAGWVAARTAPAVAWSQGSGYRPFGWRDAESRTDVRRATFSEHGTNVVLEVTRPLRAGGVFAGGDGSALLNLRGEFWLLDGKLDHPRRLDIGATGVWAACFAPDGSRLAGLTLTAPGKVGFVVWELSTGKHSVLSRANVELFLAKFRTASSAYGAPSGFFQVPRQYLWLDANSILFVDHGSRAQQSLLAGSSLPSTLQAARDRAEEGLVSVRVWSDKSPTCGAGGRLAIMACDTGEVRELYKGDVRGVSLSPNRRWLAVVAAAGRLAPIRDRPMDWPLRATTSDDDPLVRLKLLLVDLSRAGMAREIHGVVSVGNVAPSRLPRWSEDSTRVALPVRADFTDVPSTGSDAVWEVVASTGGARKWPACSALDAELVAEMLTADGLNAEALIERRPKEIRPGNYTTAGQIAGGAWECAPQQIMFWNAPELHIITPTQTIAVPGKFASVEPTVLGGTVGTTVAVRTDGATTVIKTCSGRYRSEDVTTGLNWNLLAIDPMDSAVIYSEDAEAGTYLIRMQPGAPRHTSKLSFNTYFRHIARAESRTVSHTFPDGSVRSGILQLPIGHRSGERHPVILWAYPNSNPTITGPFTRANSYANSIYPVQYLLTKGFAFFEAPFPIRGKLNSEPMRAAVDAVVPWLDVLAGQPEIQPDNFGFFGHSNAGYVALALEALSNKFKAIVAWGTFPEIGFDALHSWAGDVALDCGGGLVQADRMFYEDRNDPYVPQPAPPWRNPMSYMRNDPLFNLSGASTPLLLVEGEFDGDPREVEEVYSILDGRDIPVELAYYWAEGHVFASPGDIRDSWIRTERFFHRHLCGR